MTNIDGVLHGITYRSKWTFDGVTYFSSTEPMPCRWSRFWQWAVMGVRWRAIEAKP